MHQQIKSKNYVWGLLGLIYSNIVLGEEILDLKEEGVETHVEALKSEVPMLHEIVDEGESQSSMVRNGEHQDLLFIKSDNLIDHLVSSGSTPFTQSETFNMLVLPLNRDAKLKEVLDKQKKEWLDRLIEEYLHRFPNNKQ
jgi:hypothetical protein